MDITLCSYNIRFVLDRWDERRPFLEKTLVATNADVFALQEVNIGMHHGQHAHLRDELSSALSTPFTAFGSPGARWYIERIPYLGALLSGERNPIARFFYDGYARFNERFLATILGRHTQTIYHNEVLRVLLYGLLGTGWVFGTTLLARSALTPEGADVLLVGGWRAAQCVHVTTTVDKKMLVVNVHLSSALDQEDIRIDEARQICDWIDAKCEVDDALTAVAIMGDFNCFPHGDCYKYLVGRGYKSAHNTCHSAEPEVTFHQGLEAPTKDVGDECTLDYIFLKGDSVTVKYVQVVGQTQCGDDSTLFPSDHFGLVARLTLAE
ncbi:hypothetical protein SDRG_00842 [Saprolegnia diclina VS20]|uniref:Endonuclease/exonuclease/phosphatase domain-containing protein n=1 Tax=Saprolegnia diclina (strain VS20) TaxID=1156394 RepID=T0R6C9_SAPDV|nr:hypothetical protein SDRG_00842 [Saprolegnia diclina VS20]EQC41995.1 hypothetical protein SDRG_00842 [Saprolegnia diclina VS20]|eukprot:XP_008604564.1 hypothetical protein SDRG_00842 [Saprolegnia diclina VS20]